MGFEETQMIEATVYNRDQAEVCKIWMRVAPHVGDHIWLRTSGREGVRVIRVAHQCDCDWSPSMKMGEPLHKLVLHVEDASL